MAVPFVIPVSWWHKRNPHFTPDSFRLFLSDEEKKLRLTKVGALLELWRDVDGVRVPVTSSRSDVNVMACRDGSRLYIAVSNGSGHRLRADLKVSTGAARIQRISQRRLYIERAEIQSCTDVLQSLKDVPLAYDETSLLIVELDSAPGYTGELDRRVFCAKEILQPTGQPAGFTIVVPADHTRPRTCRLRLGLWRHGCFPAGGTVTVNGKEFQIPGFQDINTSWFGIREVEIPVELLQGNNRIVASFPDDRGLVTSAVFHSEYFTPTR
jgi:hypothetical protein